MFPRRGNYVSKYKKGTRPESQPRPSSFRFLKPKDRSFPVNKDYYFTKRQKPHVPAGMFANAISSVSAIPTPQFQSSYSKHSSAPEAYLESPEGDSKFCNIPHPVSTRPWDFSDVSSNVDKTVYIPAPQRMNSDEESSKTATVSTSSASPEPVPWLSECSSADGTSNLMPNRTETFEYSDNFEETIDRFSTRLDQIGALPTLPLQNNSDSSMGKIEKALITVALSQTKDGDCKKALPLYDLLVERSDWLIFQEEFNDETDYLPKDPFYTHDIVSSEFEEFVQEKEAAKKESYTNMMSTASQKVTEIVDPESPSNPFPLFEECHNSDSQEDFFNISFPSSSQNKPEVCGSRGDNYPTFDELCSNSTLTNNIERKRKVVSELFTPQSSTSSKRPIQAVDNNKVLARQNSCEYSPFNFDLLSDSSPSSSKKSQPPSKYSMWK